MYYIYLFTFVNLHVLKYIKTHLFNETCTKKNEMLTKLLINYNNKDTNKDNNKDNNYS